MLGLGYIDFMGNAPYFYVSLNLVLACFRQRAIGQSRGVQIKRTDWRMQGYLRQPTGRKCGWASWVPKHCQKPTIHHFFYRLTSGSISFSFSLFSSILQHDTAFALFSCLSVFELLLGTHSVDLVTITAHVGRLICTKCGHSGPPYQQKIQARREWACREE